MHGAVKTLVDKYTFITLLLFSLRRGNAIEKIRHIEHLILAEAESVIRKKIHMQPRIEILYELRRCFEVFFCSIFKERKNL